MKRNNREGAHIRQHMRAENLDYQVFQRRNKVTAV